MCEMNWIISIWSICELWCKVLSKLMTVFWCYICLWLWSYKLMGSLPQNYRFWRSAIVQPKTPTPIPLIYHKGAGSLLGTSGFPLPCSWLLQLWQGWLLRAQEVKCEPLSCCHCHLFKLKYHIGTRITACANSNSCTLVSCNHQCLWASPCSLSYSKINPLTCC